jgi:hypothetical protein
MSSPPVEIIKKKGMSDEFLRRIKTLGDSSVLVGIPGGSKTGRSENIRERARKFTSSKKKSKKEKKRLFAIARFNTVTNAQALRIFTLGSSLNNQPARPVIEPAIQAKGNKERIVAEIALATKSFTEGRIYQADQHLDRAGRIARDAAKDWFFDTRNGWPENSASTVAKKGFDQPGIDSTAMRNAITFVRRKS